MKIRHNNTVLQQCLVSFLLLPSILAAAAAAATHSLILTFEPRIIVPKRASERVAATAIHKTEEEEERKEAKPTDADGDHDGGAGHF